MCHNWIQLVQPRHDMLLNPGGKSKTSLTGTERFHRIIGVCVRCGIACGGGTTARGDTKL
jgi:hypothetical protein